MTMSRKVRAFLDGAACLVHEVPRFERRTLPKSVQDAFFEDLVVLDIDVRRARAKHLPRRRRPSTVAA